MNPSPPEPPEFVKRRREALKSDLQVGRDKTLSGLAIIAVVLLAANLMLLIMIFRKMPAAPPTMAAIRIAETPRDRTAILSRRPMIQSEVEVKDTVEIEGEVDIGNEVEIDDTFPVEVEIAR